MTNEARALGFCPGRQGQQSHFWRWVADDEAACWSCEDRIPLDVYMELPHWGFYFVVGSGDDRKIRLALRDGRSLITENKRLKVFDSDEETDLVTQWSCSDGNCEFGHPGGMHTNGGCHCMGTSRSPPVPWGEARRSIRLALKERKDLIVENRRLKEELRLAQPDYVLAVEGLLKAETKVLELREQIALYDEAVTTIEAAQRLRKGKK